MNYWALLILGLLTFTNSRGQERWQIGIDAQLLLAHSTSHDPSGVLKASVDTPTGTGGLVVSRLLKPRGLFIESGVGYRQVEAAFALRTYSFNGSTSGGGIGVWLVPVMLRQDLMTALIPNWHRRWRISLKAGLINEFVSEEGVSKSSFGSTGGNISLTGRSAVAHHYSVSGCVGAELRFPIINRRLDGLVQINHYFGISELLRTTVNYSQNGGLAQQAYISNLGSGHVPVGVGLRYHVYW